MNSIRFPDSTPPAVAKSGDGTDEFAIHFHLPDVSRARMLLSADNAFMFLCLAIGFETLVKEAFGPQVEVGAEGDLNNGLIIFNAADRSKALLLTRKYLCLFTGVMEVARFHRAEQHWVTMHPESEALLFNRWLTPEMFADRRRRSNTVVVMARQAGASLPDSPGDNLQT